MATAPKNTPARNVRLMIVIGVLLSLGWYFVNYCWMFLNFILDALLDIQHQVSSILAARDLRSAPTSTVPVNSIVLFLPA
jgi:hypothetical protein